jgi:hypothetical protein
LVLHLARASKEHHSHLEQSTLRLQAFVGAVNSATNAGGSIVTLAGEASTAGLTAAEYASGVGEIKLGYDAITYAGALVGCKLGIFDAHSINSF